MGKEEFIILCILGLILNFKMKLHWKFYLIDHNEDLNKDIIEYFQRTTKIPSFLEGLIDFFRFPGPFFSEVISNDDRTKLLKGIRLKIYALLAIWWMIFGFLIFKILRKIIMIMSITLAGRVTN